MATTKPSNARGGPKTNAGKKRSSQNSLKVGAYARELVLPQESAEEFELLYETFVRDLNPQDIVGQSLVRDMVGIAWKQLRLNRFETKVLIELLDAPIREEEYSGTTYLWRDEVQNLFQAIEAIDEEFADGAMRGLVFANTIKGVEPTAELEQQIAEHYPVLHDFLNATILKMRTAHSPAQVPDEIRLVPMLGAEDAPFAERLDLAIQELKKVVWLFEHQAAIVQEHQGLQQRRLLAFMERAGGSRVHDDLRRSFAKTMSEYRKHEAWRFDRALLEMAELPSA